MEWVQNSTTRTIALFLLNLRFDHIQYPGIDFLGEAEEFVVS